MRAVNLIPAEQRSGTSVGAGRSQGAAYALLVLFAGLAVMTLLYGLADHHIANSKKQAAVLAVRTQRAQAETARLAPYTSFIAMRRARTEAVAQLVDSRFDWAHAFHEFARVLPSDASISSISGTIVSTSPTGAAAGSSPSAAAAATAPPATAPPAASASTGSSSASASAGSASAGSAAGSTKSAAAVTSATPPGSVPTFTVSGCAASQAAVAETITRLRLIDGVSSVTLQSSTKTGAASGGAGSGAAGGCAPNQPAYTLQVSYEPLPTPSAATSTETKVVVATASTSKSAGARR
jgi:Tfp pilus assembly protein PilN